MPSKTRDYNKLLFTAAAMRSNPGEAEAIAARLGLDTVFAEARGPRRSFVYLLDTYTPDETRYFKVGRSVQPHVRLGQIQSGSGAAMPPGWQHGTVVRPLAIREGGAGVESTIHGDLREYRVPGTEWFLGGLAVAQYVVGQDTWDVWDGAPIPSDYDFSASIC